MSRASPIMVWIALPTTCPVRTDGRTLAMVLNRAMMPLIVAIATDVAVPVPPVAMLSSRMPGRT
jgi:hypothetical protein